MATIAEMLVKLGMDISGFKAGTDGAKKELSGLEKSMKGLESAGKAMTSIGTSISIGVTAPLMAASTALASFTVQAESMVKVRDAFDNIATAAGSSGDAILEAMRKGSQGMVSNIDMMKSFNLAAQLVSEDFALKLPEAMGYLGKVAAATGTSMDYLLDSLVRGVGRLSPLILDNLGIQVDMNAAYEKYAGELGKSVDEMSKAEKQTALMNETMKLLAENTASMPDNYGNVTQALKATFQNAKDAIGETLLPVLGEVTSSLTGTINKIVEMTTEGGNLYPALQSIGSGFSDIVSKIGGFIEKLGELDPVWVSTISNIALFLAALGPVLSITGKLTSGFATLVPKLANMAVTMGITGTASLAGAAAIAGIAVALAAVAVAVVHFNNKAKAMAEGLDAVRESALGTGASFEEYSASLYAAGDATNGADLSLVEYSAHSKSALGQLKALNSQGIVSDNVFSKLNSQYRMGIISMSDLEKEVYKYSQTQYLMGQAVDQSAGSVTQMLANIKDGVPVIETATQAIEDNSEELAIMDAIATEAEGIKSIGANFSGMITYAQQYDSIQKQINEKLELMAQIDVNGDGIADVGNKANGTQTDLEALKGEVEALQGSLETMAAQATLNMLQASIAIGGVTEAESKLFFDTAVAMGQMTREGADAAYKSYSDSIRLMNLLELDPKTGEISVDNYDAMMAIMAIEDMTISEKIAAIEAILSGEGAVEASLDNLARDRVSTVTVRTVNTGGGGGNTEMFRAAGGDVIGGMPYIVGERGPELFVPNINGEIIPNHELSDYATGNVINNYNLTMPTTARAEDVRMAFELLEAWNR